MTRIRQGIAQVAGHAGCLGGLFSVLLLCYNITFVGLARWPCTQGCTRMHKDAARVQKRSSKLAVQGYLYRCTGLHRFAQAARGGIAPYRKSLLRWTADRPRLSQPCGRICLYSTGSRACAGVCPYSLGSLACAGDDNAAQDSTRQQNPTLYVVILA